MNGVIEGFYGRPWNARQRHQLFGWLRSWGLNTYLYAPKAELKHRNRWRDLYDDVESAELGALIRDCHKHGLRFIYGLSPGLDINFSSATDFEALTGKLNQMIDLGSRHFAILFDDIPENISKTDLARFGSLAGAHCDITNRAASTIRESIKDSSILFCPTPYCGRMADLDPDYLPTLGRRLERSIEVFWTGPEIISETITVESIQHVASLLGRKPLLWDNLHANDYDFRRIYLGPYSGRSLALRTETSGILLNPNCQFEANFVPVRTLAAFVNADSSYDPRSSFEKAIEEWLPSFVPAGSECIDRNQLAFLGDLFYLPHAFGDRARNFLARFQELPRKASAVQKTALDQIFRDCDEMMGLFSKMCEIRNRDLLHALYPLLWELKEEAALVRNYTQWRSQKEMPSTAFRSPEHAPGTYRGGFVAELQRLLPMQRDGSFPRAGE
ncbi:MAG: beta-N-acetylglucosaminidase domain-containing protein [Verrucomicrobia bacterium]|nr:beta-N-acetylglucosaminidase domain-containing protein [Verrucomicrobiota bacterium]